MIRPSFIITFVIVIFYTCASDDVCSSENESYHVCGGLCEPTCINPDPNVRLCPRIVCVRNLTSGCRCNTGYLRDTQSEGACILPEECPRKLDVDTLA